MRTRIGDGATIEDSVIMGSDIYQVRGINTDFFILQFFILFYFIGLPKHIKSAFPGFLLSIVYESF